MYYLKYIIFLLVSLSIFSCGDDFDNPINNLNPPPTGEIVSKDLFGEYEVLDINTKNSVHYGDVPFYSSYDAWRPIWSYDGTKFATIESVWDTTTQYYRIKNFDIVNDDTINWRIEGHKGDLTWSPDGNTIAYLGKSNINYLNTETGNIITIPFPMSVSAISWHPDGEKIILCETSYFNEFYTLSDSLKYSFYTITPYETDIENKTYVASVVKKNHYNAYDPLNLDWSLDGKMLLISRHLDEIVVFNNEYNNFQIIPDIRGHSACWSPDGKYVLYVNWIWTSIDKAHSELHLTDINGSFDYDLKKWGKSMLVDWY